MFVIKYRANLVVVYNLFVVVFYNLLIVVVDSLFGVYKQTQSLKPMYHSFYNSQPRHSIMLNKSYGWIHWFGEYQQFHFIFTEKSMPFGEKTIHHLERLYSSHKLGTDYCDCCGLVSCPHKAILAALSCPSNSIGLRGIYGLFHILSHFFKLFGLLF